MKRPPLSIFAFLAFLAVLPYARIFQLPFISDDYLLLDYSAKWGPVSGWGDLLQNVLYRSRATSVVLTYWIRQVSGYEPWGYQAASLIFHVLNTIMVALLGLWPRIGWRISIPAAAFFALHEIHQEAVLWYSAIPEMIVFFFCAAALLLVTRGHEMLAAACFILALLSKESAVAALPVFAAALVWEKYSWRRIALVMAAPLAISALYAWGIFSAGQSHYHLSDGTFEFNAPFWRTAAISAGRMMWFWGLMGLAVVLRWRKSAPKGIVPFAIASTLILLLPYSFLTYMPRVPSRHTYLAGVGVALLAGCAWAILAERSRAWAWVIAAAFIVHNSAYVLIWKHPQFVARAQPTEILKDYARRTPPPIALTCWPYTWMVAESTVRIATGRREPGIRNQAGDGLPELCIESRAAARTQQ